MIGAPHSERPNDPPTRWPTIELPEGTIEQRIDEAIMCKTCRRVYLEATVK